MKRTEFICVALVASIIVGAGILALWSKSEAYSAPASPPAKLCPAGSYLLDYKDNQQQMPICKLEPTGCPYGDSIPLGADCDKHAPQPVPVQVEVTEGK